MLKLRRVSVEKGICVATAGEFHPFRRRVAIIFSRVRVMTKVFGPHELIIGFDENFPSYITYFNVFLVPSAVSQIYCLIAERARSMDLSCRFIYRYDLEDRYTTSLHLDSKMVQGPIRRWVDYFDLFKVPIVLQRTIRRGDCQQR